MRNAICIALVACTGTTPAHAPIAATPESTPAPDASVQPAADAASPDLDMLSDAPAAPEVAADTDEPHIDGCVFEWANPMDAEGYAFHGVDPWVKLSDATSSRCCDLPTGAILCLVGQDIWVHEEIRGGTLAFHYLVEHARLFAPKGRAPWRDLVIAVDEGGTMNPSPGWHPKPYFAARLESDRTSFRVIPTEDNACGPHGQLPCDADMIKSGECRVLRNSMARVRGQFCKSRGTFRWRGARF